MPEEAQESDVVIREPHMNYRAVRLEGTRPRR
jgi:hypothetical protein